MKGKVVAACQSCGAQMPRWVGRCPECAEWGTVVEETVGRSSDPPPTIEVPTAPLTDHDPDEASRMPTGSDEVDRVLGGGLVRGSITLLAGEPGIGKSTLALQAALAVGREAGVLLVCGEEAPSQIRTRAERLAAAAGSEDVPERIRTLADPSLPAVLGALERTDAAVAVVDSIQTVYDPELSSAPGSVTQVRECGARLARAARDRGVAVVLVGHVTKEGQVAGPRVLEHLVDVVLHFEGDRSGGVRVLRPLKNRFGSTQEVGFFEMATGGLVPIRDASRYLLADRCAGLPGSVLAACVDGQRPFVMETQALVAKTSVTMPRRTAVGVDGSRLPMLVAVLQRRLNLHLGDQDIYVSAVGGIKATETATDLPIVLALLSAYDRLALPDDLVAFGEVGLAGEVRRVQASDRRLGEIESVGCRRAAIPALVSGYGTPDLEVMAIRNVRDARSLVKRLGKPPE